MKKLSLIFLKAKKKSSKILHRYINGTKGVISLFLAILMVPFASIAGVLINSARINSAVAVFDEALCNASNSTLGTYDTFLRKRFGLLAISQNTAKNGKDYTAQNFISDTFNFYMENNLQTLSNTYISTDLNATGVYPLADTDVLQSQIYEYAKYTIPTKLVVSGFCIDELLRTFTEGMNLTNDFLNMFSTFSGTVGAVDDCIKKMTELKSEIQSYEKYKGQYKSAYDEFKGAVDDYNSLLDKKQSGQNTDETEDMENSNENQLSKKRDIVYDKKVSYIDKIELYANAVIDVVDAVNSARTSALNAINSGVKAAGNVAKTSFDLQIRSEEKQIEGMKKQRIEANKQGNVEAEKLLNENINEAQNNILEIKNGRTVLGAGLAGKSAEIKGLRDFANENYAEHFQKIYSALIELKNKVDKYTIPSDDIRLDDTSAYFLSKLVEPLSQNDIQQLLNDLQNNIYKSSFITTVKGLTGFIKAMFSFYVWFDPELIAQIDTDYYESSIGGLPSKKDRSEGSIYSLKSGYEDIDGAKSSHYKNLLGQYSSNPQVSGSVTVMESVIDAIKSDIDKIINAVGGGWKWYNFWEKIKTIFESAFDIGKQIGRLIGNIVQTLVTSVYKKLLLAGYIAYNIPNRTTYTSSALTGEEYKLPSLISNGKAYTFSGAETEYILAGSFSEIANQTSIFNKVFFLRLFFDIFAIVTNSEVSSIATAAGSASFGIGTVVVYLLYIFAEPLIDTLILVNSGKVPIFKINLYLTPSGVPKLIQAFLHLKLNDEQKNKAYKEVVNVMGAGYVNEDFPQKYADAVSAFGTMDTKIIDSLSFDYTKTLLLIMTLFSNPHTMLNRLADIIQMECTYNAQFGRPDVYVFDLDKSYTYLRAAGRFTTNEFIKISNSAGLNSTERVIYRGY